MFSCCAPRPQKREKCEHWASKPENCTPERTSAGGTPLKFRPTKAIRYIQRTVVDDVLHHHRRNVQLKQCSHTMRRLAKYLCVLTSAGVVVMMVGLEGRLQEPRIMSDRAVDRLKMVS